MYGHPPIVGESSLFLRNIVGESSQELFTAGFGVCGQKSFQTELISLSLKINVGLVCQELTISSAFSRIEICCKLMPRTPVLPLPLGWLTWSTRALDSLVGQPILYSMGPSTRTLGQFYTHLFELWRP